MANAQQQRGALKSASTPRKVRLTEPHGYIDDNGRNRTWAAGDIITEQYEIALLVSRKAPLEILE